VPGAARPRVPWAGALLVAVFAFALSAPTPVNPDIWWHLRTGRHILETGRVPRADVYSVIAHGTRWVNPSWLADVAMFALWRAGGYGLLRLLAALAAAAGVLLALYAKPSRQPAGWPAIVAAAGACVVLWPSVLMRPLLFSLPLTGFFLWVLRGRRDRWLWALPGLAALWVNLHAGFAAGLMLVFAAFAWEAVLVAVERGRSPRRLWVLLATGLACAAACLVNPFGIGVLTYPFRLTGSSVFMAKVQEWLPPTGDPAFWPYWAWLAGVAALIIVTHKRADGFDLLAVAAFAFLSLRARRQMGVFALVSLPVAAKHLSIACPWRARPRWVAAAGQALLVAALVGAAASRWSKSEDDPVPAKAAAFLDSIEFQGEVFNEYDWGGYLIWRWHPKRRAFIDGRCLVYGDRGYKEWEDAYLCKPGWEEALGRRGVGCLLLRHRRPPGPDGMPLALPFTSPHWRTVYWDDLAVVLLKATDAHRAVIAANDWGLTNPATVSGLLARRKRVDEIQQQLQRKLALDPTCAVAYANLAQCHMARRDLPRAAEALAMSLRYRPNHESTLYNLGYVEYKLGRVDAAIGHCRRAAALDPTQPIYALTLGDAYAKSGRYDAALKSWLRSKRLTRDGPVGHIDERIRQLRQRQGAAP